MRRDERGPFDGLPQLADVARPRLPPEPGHRRRAEGEVVAAVGLGHRRSEAPREDRYVVRALPQGRQAERDQVDAVEQVLAELAAGDQVGERPVRGRDDTDVHGARLAGPEHLVRAVLQDAQQFHLRPGVEFADLVEEDRTAVGRLESSLAVGAGVGEGAAHVAEHLALEERRRDAAEVHLHERAAAPPAVAVNGLGNQFLARAALAAHEHRRVGVGHAAGHLQHAQQPRITADHLAEVVARVQFLASEHGLVGVRAAAAGQAEGGGHALHHLLIGPGLRDEVRRAGLHAADRQRDRAPCGEQDHGHVRPRGFQAREQVQALLARREPREVHVLDDEVEVGPRGSRGDRLAGRGGRERGVAMLLQQQRQRRNHRRIVIDEEDHGQALGTRD